MASPPNVGDGQAGPAARHTTPPGSAGVLGSENTGAGKVVSFSDSLLEVSEGHSCSDTMSSAGTPFADIKTVPVILVLLVAMFVSSAASIAGGMVMYFESIDALTQTIDDLSYAELSTVAEKIRRESERPYEDMQSLMHLFYNPNVIYGADEAQWADVVRYHTMARLKANPHIYTLGVVLIPHDDSVDEAVYMVQWAEYSTHGNGARVFTMGLRHGPMNKNQSVTAAANATGYEMMVPAFNLSVDDASFLGGPLYSFDAGFYFDLIPADNATALSGLNPLPHVEAVDAERLPAFGRKHRNLQSWGSEEVKTYLYSGWDTLHPPPPPPHPWSKYKAVDGVGLYLYTPWQRVVKEYAAKRTLAQIVVLDEVTLDVFATTERDVDELLDQDCIRRVGLGTSVQDTECGTKLANLSDAAQLSYREITAAGKTFTKIDAKGTSAFVRRYHLKLDVVLLYMLGTSVVQEQVNDALLLLILFSCLVLVFDCGIVTLEFLFVARPMRAMSRAIGKLGMMRIEDADRVLVPYHSRKVMLREVKDVLCGVEQTVRNLEQYRTFLPSATLVEDEKHGTGPAEVDAPEGHVALVFTDIRGSTSLWEAVPSDMAISIDIHNDVMRRVLVGSRGYEVKTIGDAFMVAFAEVEDAVTFGVTVQEELVQQPWPRSLDQFDNSRRVLCRGKLIFAGLRVRIGIHAGPVDTEVNPLTGRVDFRGPTVNKAARVEGQAMPGMAAFTEEVRDALTGFPLPVLEHGEHELKGIGATKLFYCLSRPLAYRELAFAKTTSSPRSLPKDAARTIKNPLEVLRGTEESPTSSNGSFDEAARASLQHRIGTKPQLKEQNSLVKGAVDSYRRRSRRGSSTFTRSIHERHGAVAVVASEYVRGRAVSAPDNMLNSVNQLLQIIADVGTMTEGTVENVFGLTVMVTWRVSARCTEYTAQSLRFVGYIHKRAPSVGLRAGLVCGPVLHGNVGTERRKYHDVVGAAWEYSQALLRLCQMHHIPALYTSNQPLPPQFGSVCVPWEVVHGHGDWGPVVVIERPIIQRCSGLNPKISMNSFSEVSSEVSSFVACPMQKFRTAIYMAIATRQKVAHGESVEDADADTLREDLLLRPAGQLCSRAIFLFDPNTGTDTKSPVASPITSPASGDLGDLPSWSEGSPVGSRRSISTVSASPPAAPGTEQALPKDCV
eukprot:TRINITY_DN12133_c0_g2_i1.p1 TRINITY_DN12133_c0_g2~~TRINITY_DN12133_c0_g2_i1.p1  ORF type:complete len:1177 (+),score=301.67 TRINITY_DN12133_c0_g2_i1:74-3604(+)